MLSAQIGHFRQVAFVGAIECALSLASCTTVGEEASQKASRFDVGQTEQDLIQTAGSPTRRVSDIETACKQKGGKGESAVGKVSGEVLLVNAGGAWGVDEELVELARGR